MGVDLLPEIRLEFASVEALQFDYESNLRKGRAFAAGASGILERDLCALVLVHPATGNSLCLTADAVWVKRDEPGVGVGVQLHDFDDEVRAQLADFIEGGGAAAPADEPAADEPGTDEREAAGEATDGAVEAEQLQENRARNIHERVRKLSSREREVMARQGILPERVALERCYGSVVWEGLLRNPNLTPPEVARIAKNGNVPKPLVAIIVSNGTWMGIGEIQRALLGNPRVVGQHLDRILRSLSQSDLARVAQQPNYRGQVRQAAKRLIQKK